MLAGDPSDSAGKPDPILTPGPVEHLCDGACGRIVGAGHVAGSDGQCWLLDGGRRGYRQEECLRQKEKQADAVTLRNVRDHGLPLFHYDHSSTATNPLSVMTACCAASTCHRFLHALGRGIRVSTNRANVVPNPTG